MLLALAYLLRDGGNHGGEPQVAWRAFLCGGYDDLPACQFPWYIVGAVAADSNALMTSLIHLHSPEGAWIMR
ncbi:MAG: hypothetical protein OEX80_09630, partial [Candidatus Aminicenantes bacterium]|nr:hypothetical protein [Candidatus Aminicenantes bacterium]